MNGFHSASQTAKILGIDVSRVLKLCRHGRLGRKVDGRWIISDHDIDEYRKRGPLPAGRPKS